MLVKWQPVRSLLNTGSIFDEFFDESWPARVQGFDPHIDVRETDKHFEISAELPGLDRDDFKLSVEHNVLTLEGEKKFETEEKKEGYYRSERRYGSFHRQFRLNDSVDAGKISAEFKNGILKIEVPKTEKAKPKAIDVKIS
jgi:HSP20 family protein